MSHDHGALPEDMYSEAFWNARYRSADSIWSGNPNPLLVTHIADLEPGTALDVACGEGADAIWLASRGWQVTAVDISTVALARAAQRADAVGPEIAERITWEQVDVLTWSPPQRQFDLVSSQFMHVPRAIREAVHHRIAEAVRPGGTLLIVGHHPSDLQTSIRRPNLPDFLFTAEEVAAGLDPNAWQIVEAAAPEREAIDTEGQSVTIRDALLRAVHRR